MKLNNFTRLSLLALALFAAGSLQAQFVTNGGFETWTGTCPTNTPPDGWNNYSTNLGPDQAGACTGTVTSHGGSSHMNIVWINSGLEEGATYNVTGLTIGNRYRVAYWARENGGLYTAGGDVKVELHMNSIMVQSTPNIPPSEPWAEFTYEFTAVAPSETIGVRAKPGTNGTSGSAAIDDFSVTELVSVRDGMMHKPSAYPNPFDGQLFVAQGDYVTTDLHGVDYRVTNVLGQTVHAGKMDLVGGKAQIDLSMLQPGTYFFTTQIGSDFVVENIVKR